MTLLEWPGFFINSHQASLDFRPEWSGKAHSGPYWTDSQFHGRQAHKQTGFGPNFLDFWTWEFGLLDFWNLDFAPAAEEIFIGLGLLDLWSPGIWTSGLLDFWTSSRPAEENLLDLDFWTWPWTSGPGLVDLDMGLWTWAPWPQGLLGKA